MELIKSISPFLILHVTPRPNLLLQLIVYITRNNCLENNYIFVKPKVSVESP